MTKSSPKQGDRKHMPIGQEIQGDYNCSIVYNSKLMTQPSNCLCYYRGGMGVIPHPPAMYGSAIVDKGEGPS